MSPRSSSNRNSCPPPRVSEWVTTTGAAWVTAGSARPAHVRPHELEGSTRHGEPSLGNASHDRPDPPHGAVDHRHDGLHPIFGARHRVLSLDEMGEARDRSWTQLSDSSSGVRPARSRARPAGCPSIMISTRDGSRRVAVTPLRRARRVAANRGFHDRCSSGSCSSARRDRPARTEG